MAAHTREVRSISFASTGRVLASGADDLQIILWDVVTGKPLRKLKGHTDMIMDVCFGPSGKVLASGDVGKNIFLWDTQLLSSYTSRHVPKWAKIFFGTNKMPIKSKKSIYDFRLDTPGWLIEHVLAKQPEIAKLLFGHEVDNTLSTKVFTPVLQLWDK